MIFTLGVVGLFVSADNAFDFASTFMEWVFGELWSLEIGRFMWDILRFQVLVFELCALRLLSTGLGNLQA